MGRKAQFSHDDFFQATLRVIAGRGPAGTTIAAISREMDAPVGSIYHRYSSLNHVLAETWLGVVEHFQSEFLRHISAGDGIAAALHTPRHSRLFPDQARLLLCYNREELISGAWPEEVRTRAETLRNDIEKAMDAFLKKKPGIGGKEKRARFEFAMIHAPLAATKPWLKSGRRIPKFVDEFVETTYRTLAQ